MEKLKIEYNNGLQLLSNIPFDIDADKAAEGLKISKNSEDYSSLKEMIAAAKIAGSPKAVYRISYPEQRTEETVIIEGITLKSRVLSVNLENVHRVFLYVVTCGQEIELWSKAYTDPLLAYFADYIKVSALNEGMKFFTNYIKEMYHLSKFSKMAPGSLKDWPIEQQKMLFEIIGDVKGTAGVVLTDRFLMQPSKSVSGILFPTEISFESCMLCPREKCIGRRAPYNSRLYEDKYRATVANPGVSPIKLTAIGRGRINL